VARVHTLPPLSARRFREEQAQDLVQPLSA
jgi:hypothetical protein